jgi:hypothetical protein
MNVVDSAGWLECFADGPNADVLAPAIEDGPACVVPSLSLYAVCKRVGDVTMSLALKAAKLSAARRWPMADSMMLATACVSHAHLVGPGCGLPRHCGGAVCGKACVTE